ncbi:MAG: type III secretion system export apparatus subunit SctV [Burkholderiales bacterium]|nr:type III secretion system export apparatus subunit SctV [Burkholderiales bacterium]
MKKALDFFSNNREIVLVLMILLVITMMIIPLPTMLMDIIITFNISISILILMVVVYLRSPLGLTSFPTILLVLALVRIGITVSTSRLILLNADAGEVVLTFGEFVAGGNLVVGMIVFIIITIINFIVITKGSERVAEVAARFSLDAMPGKQMSIDSDLRAGNITPEVANEKRNMLNLESKLHGSMDGAMKFVKGDAIASIIDILINLVGGLVIGIVQRGLDFSAAITTYSILTIGDGLVQQIPALLISLTAGMMITQVNEDGDNKNMGQNILKQIFSEYKAIIAACALIFIMGFVPGMPTSVFLVIFTVFAGIGTIMWRRRKIIPEAAAETKAVKEEGADDENAQKDDQANMKLLPLMLYLAPNLKNSAHLDRIKAILTNIQQEIMFEIGVVIPQIIIRYNDQLQNDEYQLLVSEIPVTSSKFQWNSILLLDTQEQNLAVLDMDNAVNNNLQFGATNFGVWINGSNKALCNEYNIRHLDYEQFLLLHFKTHVKKHLADFLGIQETKNILDKMTEFQELIKELLRIIPLNKITEIFQRLVAENISIRNFKVILDAMLEWSQKEKEPLIITEYVRKALGRYIAFKFSGGSYLFPTILLSLETEDIIRDSIRYANNGSYIALDPRISAEINDKVGEIIQDVGDVPNLVIVTQLDIRRYVKAVIEKNYPSLPVLSFQELEGLAEFNNLGIIEV